MQYVHCNTRSVHEKARLVPFPFGELTLTLLLFLLLLVARIFLARPAAPTAAAAEGSREKGVFALRLLLVGQGVWWPFER